MKKILSTILCLTLSSMMMIPAFAANEEPPTPEAFTYEEIKAMYAGEIAVPPADETTETEQAEPEAEETEEAAEPETPETTEEETEAPSIDDIINSEELEEILENLGQDGEEIEDALENGDYEIIYITEEEFEQMRKDAAISVFTTAFNYMGQSALLLLMAPVSPLFIVVPFAGPFMLIIPLIAVPFAVATFAGVVVSPAVSAYTYFNYELEPGYEIIN